MTLLLLKRSTAALLPLSFLWLCACCVSTCGQEAAADTARQAALSSAALYEVRGESGCEDGCPLAPDLKAAAAESATSKAGTQAAAAALPPSTSDDVHADHTARSRPNRRPPRAAPPLELLSVLRV